MTYEQANKGFQREFAIAKRLYEFIETNKNEIADRGEVHYRFVKQINVCIMYLNQATNEKLQQATSYNVMKVYNNLSQY